MPSTVVRNDDKSRYEILVDGSVVGFSDYRMRGDRQVFVHTEIDPEFRGRDLAATLVRAALDDARANGYRVDPPLPVRRRVHRGAPRVRGPRRGVGGPHRRASVS